jgi:hypothetical protein
MVSEHVVCLNDEPAEDDKIGEFGRVDNSLRLARNFGQPEASCNWGQP